MEQVAQTLRRLDSILCRANLQSRLQNIEHLRPPKVIIEDTISMMGGRQQLKLDQLKAILQTYFQGLRLEVIGNDIYIPISSTIRNAKYAYFTGALNAIIESYKFGDNLVRPASYAGVTFEDTARRKLKSFAIKDFDALKNTLNTYWPESDPAIWNGVPAGENAALLQWGSQPRFRSLVYVEVQQMLYMFLPYNELPMMENSTKATTESTFKQILARNLPLFESLCSLINEMKIGLPKLPNDPHYMTCYNFHMERIHREQRQRWAEFESQ
jgi:hypothetical protein